jgi:hypothetical protein
MDRPTAMVLSMRRFFAFLLFLIVRTLPFRLTRTMSAA